MKSQNENKTSARRWILLFFVLALAGVAAWKWWPRAAPRIDASALAAMPLLQQGDYDQPVAVFAGEPKSVATSGCGAVCMAMAIGYLTGDDLSPDTLFQWVCDNQLYFGDGLGHDALVEMARRYGLTGAWIANDKLDEVRAALERGYPVVAHMGPGTFTQRGHYILLRGVAGPDSVLVNDPQSIPLSRSTHRLRDIQRELRRENCFMIVKP